MKILNLPKGKNKIPSFLKVRSIWLLMLFITTITYANTEPNQTSSQYISLKMNGATLGQVISSIERQTNYSFIYNVKTLDLSEVTSIEVTEVTIAKLLQNLFGKTDVVYEVVDEKILLRKIKPSNTKVSASNNSRSTQDFTITGTIIDSNGIPLSGATILEKGTANGVVADFDGNFTITVSDSEAVLEVSYLGYNTKEVKYSGDENIQITLDENAASLSEVVVVGYGSTKKENLTGSVGQIDASELGDRPNANILNSLQGTLPGLNIQPSSGDPRANPELNVRGFNSINSGSPLVLIDGIQGDINLINPLDVESVTVLKDAASAAIYGARGAFGVILITTKKGVSGKTTIEYSNNVGFISPTTRTDFIKDPVLYGRTVDAAQNGFNGRNWTGYDSEENWALLQQVADGEIEPFREEQGNGTFKFYDNTDWFNYLYKKTQISKIHNVSISGGGETLKAYMSARYFNTNTLQKIADEDINRYNIKANVSYKINDWLEISDNIQYNTGDDIEYGGWRGGWRDTFTSTKNYLFPFQPNFIEGESYDFNGASGHAALEEQQNFQTSSYKQFVNTFFAKINPTKDWVINLDYSNNFTFRRNATRLNQFNYLTSRRVEAETVGINRLTELRTEENYEALNIYSTFEKSIAEKHNFKLLVGFNQENFERDIVLAEQGGLLNPSFSNLNLGTELLRADGSASLWAIRGFFGRFNYNFKNKYLLEVNARYDGSSRFPEESRYGFFPSVSAGWLVSQEKFWEPLQDVFNSFKLRAGYGELGNQNVEPNTFLELLPVGQSNWLVDGLPLNFLGNPNPLPNTVTWETTKNLNFGVDLGMFQNKLTLSLDVYRKEITDMYLAGEPLPSVFGSLEPKENNGDLEVKGFEFGLTYQNSFELGGSPLNFRSSVNLSNFVGRITRFPNSEGLLSSFYEGQRLGDIWGYRVDGQFQSDEEAAAYQNTFENQSQSLGQVYNFAINVARNDEFKGLRAGDIKYLDSNGDGEIGPGDNTIDNPGDLQVIGNAIPKLPFGFTFAADWKGIDLQVIGNGVVSQDWYPSGKTFWGTYERPYLSFLRKDLVANAWSPDNPSGTYPQIARGFSSLGSNRQLSAVNDYYLTNVGFMRIKNLTLGYSFSPSILERAKLSKLRLYVSGENLFTKRFGGLTKYIDPEQAGSGISFSDPNAATNRSDADAYPILKTISLGIQIGL